ncbi:retrovirus-related pol polyprotein from transposon TNT 1-94 [Tanacetum coccineum]
MAKASPTQAWLWHRRLSHLNFEAINLLLKNHIVNGLPKLKYVKDQLCSSCKMGKAKRSSFKTKTVPSSKGRLHLLHMDLCGPMRVESINGKKYIPVIIDDYSRYTWTRFLRSKDETPEGVVLFKNVKRTPEELRDVIMVTVRLKLLSFKFKNSAKFMKIVHEDGEEQDTGMAGLMFKALKVLSSFLVYVGKMDLILIPIKIQDYPFLGRALQFDRTHVWELFEDLLERLINSTDDENLDKMKEKEDPCIFVSSCLAPQQQMTSDDNTSGLAPQRQKTYVHKSTELGTNDHSNEPSNSKLVPNDVPTTGKTYTSP